MTAVNFLYGDITELTLDEVRYDGGRIGGIVRPFIIVENDREVESIVEDEVVDYIKNIKIKELDKEMNQRVAEGFSSESTGYFFAYGAEQQAEFTQTLTLISAGLYFDDFVEWRTLDVGVVTLSLDEFKTVMIEGNAYKRAWTVKYREVVDNIKQMTNDTCKMSSLKAISLGTSPDE
ncbi:hypothetical protein Q9R38_26320 [Priestia aryabhattai]|uniref:DUF4376 domain-containing protein n=1 Tax=Priestia aryabhattai TaxID=412384 RepID=UPI002881978A|nr:hypothetical protein [Priestia aryabhattai]MDT0150061.1 hypothetical protein [Priestia aryabhattai]MDT0155631.1 hypothetical protein [Priestia aryabhattai]